MVSVRFRGANLSVRSLNAARDCDSFHHTAATTAYSSLPSADYAARGAPVLFLHLGSHSSVVTDLEAHRKENVVPTSEASAEIHAALTPLPRS